MSKSKRTRSGGDEPPQKRHCKIDLQGNQAVPLALHDNNAWEILRRFLTTSMSLSEMDDALVAYLSNQYSADNWEEPQRLLFSGDADDAASLRNLTILWKRHILDPAENSSVGMPASRTDSALSRSCVQKSHMISKAACKFIANQAEENDEDEDSDRRTVSQREVAAAFDNMASRFEDNSSISSQDRQDHPIYGALQHGRMYLLHVQRTTTEYIAEHLRKKGFAVTISAWLAGQLYMVADSPKTIAESLPSSLHLAVKDYTRIAEEEREAVERTQFELPNPAWLRIKSGEYRGNVAQVFEHLPNSVVAVLVVARRFPYSMPRGSQALIEWSCLPNNTTVSDIIQDDEVVRWKYKGESYYMGLLLKTFHCDRLEHIASPHADNIRLHLDSGWNKPFIQATLAAYSLQFLRIGDWARVVKGSLHGELGQVTSTDHTLGTLSLQSALDERSKEMTVRLQDVERVFQVGDTVRVVAGSYLGLQGHIIEMHGDTFQVCQDTTNEQVIFLCNLIFDGLSLGMYRSKCQDTT
ncbi:uncharacterized protein F5147DRAFT_773866 [Suillus discolor]|uniref:KOW domain-containing protein n=1 Tax=Suillus discolor TaxID=1912936 RepID=A0A9P7JUD2_9AGAM|nr:uncharacterized protein F5147DRAFT_773866 [Suillus discolor]KAG2108279.1 hypothetical protein F5147DRAFT_773866 [Suillus discolor]